jgi:hypothetical protein
MERVTLYHCTAAARLPLIETEGLRTRIDLSDRLGDLGSFDGAATGRFARGRRVSGWISRAHAATLRPQLGPGVVSFTVDPRRAVADRAADREADPVGVWGRMRPLAEWIADSGGDVGALPHDLEVHQELPVRAKLVRIHAPDVMPEELGVLAPLVGALADTDRVAAKLLMHLALIVADGDANDPAYLAACALAWRDREDDRDLPRRLARADAEAVLEAVLVEHEEIMPAAVVVLRDVLDALRSEAAAADGDLGTLVMERSDASLARIVASVGASGGRVRG